MRALRFHEFGTFDKLKVETLPDPQPKPDEVVVRMRKASLNPSDAKNVLGRLPRTARGAVPVFSSPALLRRNVAQIRARLDQIAVRALNRSVETFDY